MTIRPEGSHTKQEVDMVKCELCNKEFKNTQGLRGHKTFVHGQTGSSKILSAPAATEQRLSEVEQLLGITSQHTVATVQSATGVATQQPVSRLRARLERTDTKAKPITQQVTELTPNPIVLLFGKNSHDCPAFLHDLDRLQTRVNDHQGAINWVRKEFSLVKKGDKA